MVNQVNLKILRLIRLKEKLNKIKNRQIKNKMINNHQIKKLNKIRFQKTNLSLKRNLKQSKKNLNLSQRFNCRKNKTKNHKRFLIKKKIKPKNIKINSSQVLMINKRKQLNLQNQFKLKNIQNCQNPKRKNWILQSQKSNQKMEKKM